MRPTFVIDASIILAWFNPHEHNDYADKILDCLTKQTAIVPQLCCLEINNVFRAFVKKKSINEFEMTKAIQFISNLPLEIDKVSLSFQMPFISNLARDHDLTIYDACYLELALRLNIPLSTLDKQLLKAMRRIKVLLQEPRSELGI